MNNGTEIGDPMEENNDAAYTGYHPSSAFDERTVDNKFTMHDQKEKL